MRRAILLFGVAACGELKLTPHAWPDAGGPDAPTDAGPDPVPIDADPRAPDAAPLTACQSMVTYGAGPPHESEVWLAGPDGGGARNLSESAGHDSIAVWSPDGTRVAFESDRDGYIDIWVAPVAGGPAVKATRSIDRILQMEGFEFSPLWSPDGYRLAVTRDDRIWVVLADGSLPTRLSDMTAESGRAAWSPDGARLAFVSGDDLWLVPVDQSASPRNLTATPTQKEDDPIWSPDGTRLAFTRASDIWVAAADGSGAVNLTPLTDSTDRLPRWLPDGTGLVFSSNREGSYKIFRVSTQGGIASRISNHTIPAGVGSGDLVSDVSPDGARVAFTRVTYNPQRQTAAGTVRLDGSDLVTFATGASAPSWSPCMDGGL